MNEGTHKHKCQCGHIWEHSNKCAGNQEAHTCEVCGSQQWSRYYASNNEKIKEVIRDLKEYFEVQ